MFVTYVLQSEKNRKHYIGHTKNLIARLKKHNSGSVRSTKSGIPWIIIYKEMFKSKSEAYLRELMIKSFKGGIQFKEMLRSDIK
ncbi:MAG: GIY-YIG nuclease family protein [Candidatus Kerfeldbacteria bacterium]